MLVKKVTVLQVWRLLVIYQERKVITPWEGLALAKGTINPLLKVQVIMQVFVHD